VSVQSATRKSESAEPEAAPRRSVPSAKKAKLPVLLTTRDETLWPLVGTHVGSQLILKQLDSIDELLASTPSGQAAIVLWDARGETDANSVLSRLQLHSPRFAVVALDDAGGANTWTSPIELRQVIAHGVIPLQAENFRNALDSAHEEVSARIALLGEAGDAGDAALAAGATGAASGAGAAAATSGVRRIRWIPAAIVVAVLIVLAGTYLAFKQSDAPVKPATAVSPQHSLPPPEAGQPSASTVEKPAGNEEKVDLAIEKAQQAMLDRHYIDPAEGSALSLYRSALLLDPDNGEAHQGLQRLAEILFARVQSALDEKKIDVALQSLETARSINPDDARLAALDERIATLRAEFGPAQILAAINAQNFERAAQLIDDAARGKSLPAAKLNQLREEMRRKHEEFDVANLVKLVDTRLQQDKLLEPRNDSAVFYFNQARAAGANTAALLVQSQEIYKRLAQITRAAIEARRFAEAERWLAEMRSDGAPAATLAGLQRELSLAHSQQTAAAPEQPQYADLAQARLAQGKVTEPDTDSALFYVNQLRAADPKNSALQRISSAVQAQILEQARTALDAAQTAKAEGLLQMAGDLGASADLNALNERLMQMKLAAAGAPEVPESSLTRVKGVELDYPETALRKNIEGWVELSFEVTADGKVTKVKVLDATPAGIFDVAATRALSHVRYKPIVLGGKPTAVSTKLRIAFRMNK
jgi:TonB family protein